MSSFRIILKILQLIFCVAALIMQKLADSHANRVMKFNQKFSTEWTLLNSLNWNQEGTDFATFLFGGFTFICGVCLISSFRTTSMETCEWIMISIGALMFLIQGSLILASIDYVPEQISIYGFLLGSVCGILAILFIVDVCVNKNAEKPPPPEKYILPMHLEARHAPKYCQSVKPNYVTEV